MTKPLAKQRARDWYVKVRGVGTATMSATHHGEARFAAVKAAREAGYPVTIVDVESARLVRK